MAEGGVFSTKPTDVVVAEAGEAGLKRAVGRFDLGALGLGAIIGTGIFVIIGQAIPDAGPAVVLSFVLAGLTCAFSALSYAELASSIPVAGSAYTYAYATVGELVAWIIGWDLVLEYSLAVAGVSVGWGQYLNELFDSAFSFTLPTSISAPPGEGGEVNLTAAALVVLVMGVVILGVRETARFNTAMVITKVGVVLLFIALAVGSFTGSHFDDFSPNGVEGIRSGAALVFFAFIGFDAISTSGEEARNPQRDMPVAILGALGIATLLYCLVSLTAIGALPASQLGGSPAPLATALEDGAGLSWGATLISVGALVAITSVALTMLYGQTRIALAMARDGLLPTQLARLSPTRRTPIVAAVLFGGLIAVIAALIPLSEIAKLLNLGTLFAFVLVNLGVIVLRHTRPDMERPFKVPFSPVFPLIGAGLCIYLMTTLEAETWLRFVAWLAAGLLIYALYGYRRSRLRSAA